MPAPLRDPPSEAVELIKAFEGIPDGDPSTVNIDAYLCPANVWTIGWGHAIVHEGQQLKGSAAKSLARQLYPGGITMDQAVALLRADLLRFCAGVQRLVKLPVNDQQFGALLAFGFNVGLGALGQSTLLRKLNAGDVAGAAEQFLVWDKARVNGVLKPLAGLTRRRRAERALFLGEDWRAVAAQRVTRSGSHQPPVLPVPEAPEDQAAPAVETALAVVLSPAVAKPAAGKTVLAKKAPANKAPVNKGVNKAVSKKPVSRKTAGTKAAVRSVSKPRKAAARKPARKTGA
jgi:GH24 family phage-related lysozyme (muramidase)